nr:HU family DNA-binding protein [Moraxella osloensis]
MNKSELIAKIAEKSGLNQKDAGKALDGLTQAVSDALANGEDVTLVGFGTFKVTERKAKKGRNPATGEAIQIPAKKAPIFKAGKALKDAVK